ncbi:MAG: radical SAM/SPASM domain-containing protein [Candidatus Woesearchaeota archaeon]
MEGKNNVLSRSKIFAHPDRLFEWLNTGITHPITAQIDPSNRCNYDCNQCAGLRIDRNAELTEEELFRIIDQISPFIKGIEFTGGGDPLMNKHSPDSMVYAKNKGIDVGLVINGHLLNTQNIPKIISSATYVRVSVDAINEESHKYRKGTRNNNSFQKVINNIKDLVAERDGTNSSCTIGLGYLTDFGEDSQNFRAFALLAKNLGANYAQFRPYHHADDNIISELENLSDLNSDTFNTIYSKDKYLKIKGTYERAYADEFKITISATGDIYPDCFTRGIKNFSYGNLLKEDFEAIWKSEKRLRISESKLLQNNCPKQCYYDVLSQQLWDIYAHITTVAHKNFI